MVDDWLNAFEQVSFMVLQPVVIAINKELAQ